MSSPTTRIQSVDILRGLIMLIMALDHVRDFFHVTAMTDDPTNLATTTPWLFFTRWITHYCAPTFVFLSGVSAHLSGLKKTKKEQSIFLIKRGVWLVLVDIIIMTLAITFNPLYNVIILQVIWAIGFSMIILGLLIRTSLAVIVVVGALIVFGHNVFDYIKVSDATIAGKLVGALLTNAHTFQPLSSERFIFVFYTAIPWTGVMLLGYAFGIYFKPSVSATVRKDILVRWGFAVLAFFIVMRYINYYGDPAPWSRQKNGIYTLISFLNTTKYPCSLLYICMTLGPSILMLALFENVRSKLTDVFIVYGKVPFFYYVLHFYLIHFLLVILFFATGHSANQIVDPKTIFLFRPEHFGYGLPVVYLIWLFVIAVLYKPCKRFVEYKRTHRQWWLSYV